MILTILDVAKTVFRGLFDIVYVVELIVVVMIYYYKRVR